MADKFNFDDDFDLDTGVNVEDFGTEESNNSDEVVDFGTDESPTEQQAQPQEDTKSVKKTAIIAAAAGFVIIVAALGIRGLVNKNKNNSEPTVKPTQTTVGQTAGNQSGTQPVTVYDSGWVQFTKDNGISIDQEISSNFTITSIKHLAKVVNENNDKMVKSIVTGNISGLVGTYEIEVPYEKARHLTVGAVFNITYRCTTENGVKIIGEVKY